MKAFNIEVERGDRLDAYTLLVIAETDRRASKKAKQHAVKDSGFKTGWRVTSLREQAVKVIL